MYEFDKMCFEGGGVFGIAYIGAIKYLEDNDLLKQVKEYSGTSSGSIISTMLALGYNHSEMYAFMESVHWDKLYDYNIGCFSFFPGFGIYKGDKLMKIYQQLVKKKTGSVHTTFKDLYERTGKKLHMCAVNVNQQKTVYFSVDTHPSMELCLALRFSTSFPFVFKSLKYKGDYYVDGGVMDNYPIEVFNGCDKVLGMKLLTNPKEDKRIDGFLDFTKHIFGSMIEGQEVAESYPYVDQTAFIEIRTENLLTSVLNIGNQKNEFRFYHAIGFKSIVQFFENYRITIKRQHEIAEVSKSISASVSELELREEVDGTEECNNDEPHPEE